jgi:hypothetical protein
VKLVILSVGDHEKGQVFRVTAQGKTQRILFTFHALDRIAKWQLAQEVVLQALLDPEEVLKGHRNRFIAHRRAKGHVVRVIYEYDEALPVVITVYNPVAERYFKGGGNYEDRILT